jgi:hypothetical protein
MAIHLPTRARRRLVAELFLALALLLAQGAAQAHAYSHLRAGSKSSDFTATGGQICSECLSCASLLSAAGSPRAPLVSFVPGIAAPIAALTPTSAETSRHYAFRSRAPPALF